MTNREKLRKRLQKLMDENFLTREQVAIMLHSSVHRINSWLRPEGVKGANPVPLWAIELLEFKISANVATAKREGN